MKVAFAHLSPTVPASIAAAIGIVLAVFLLPGAGVQNGPTPLLAVIGGAAGRVAADLPAVAVERASVPVRTVASSAQLASTRSEHFVPRRQEAKTKTHRVHRHTRTGIVRRAPSASVQAAPPAAPATPVTTSRFFKKSTMASRKSRGHGYGRALKSRPTAGAPAPRAHAHGKAKAKTKAKAPGHSSEHLHELPPGQAKKAPTAPLPAPTTPPNADGGGNGHKGGTK